MALLFQAFDAATVAPSDSFECIPAGVYVAQATDSEIKPLKSGNGNALNFTFTILDGQHTGRKLFARLNIQHSNKTAEDIAQKQLSQFCHAAGVLKVSDSSQLHMKPVKIKVSIRKDDSGQYGDQNEVKGFEAVKNGASPGPIAPLPAARAPAATPWGAK